MIHFVWSKDCKPPARGKICLYHAWWLIRLLMMLFTAGPSASHQHIPLVTIVGQFWQGSTYHLSWPITAILNSTVIMPYPSSSYFATDASSGSSSSSRSAEVEGERSFIPVDAVTLLMLLSELHTFADNPSLATKAQQKKCNQCIQGALESQESGVGFKNLRVHWSGSI